MRKIWLILSSRNLAESENSECRFRLLDQTTFDPSAITTRKKKLFLRKPTAILEEMKALDEESADILNSILN
jgi:type I restriction enzyme M protein